MSFAVAESQTSDSPVSFPQLGLLNFECAAKSRVRVVTLARPNRDEPLPFCLLGGYERNFGIFVTKVERGSKAEDIGLKRGDQILEVRRD